GQEAKYSPELRKLVKKYQPQCLINSRIGHGCQDFIGLGDNWMRHGKMDLVVESAGTLNRTWGFKYDDHDWLKPEQVINTLVSLTENNANYLLNVGPMPDGRFTPETDQILSAIANWIADKKDAIHGTEQSPFPQVLADAYSTVKGNRLNLFLRRKTDTLQLAGIMSEIISANVPYQQDNAGNVTLDLRTISGYLPLVTLDFASAPEISQTLTVQNDSMHLAMYSGIYADVAVPAVLHDGTAGNWKTPEGAIRWEVEFPGAGMFDVFLKVQTGYLEPWSGNRVMSVSLDETDEISADLNDGEDTPHPYCTIRTVKLGSFRITEPGRKLLTLRTLSIGDDAAADLRMTTLLLNRQ
ncbi:MAG: alpha-L-fucosidase, partial [Lentisphaeria bacterium]|nr:alpha-L-fucosidase [Lentisphaeria bacterium]